MSSDELDEVKARARDIFSTRAPAFLRWGESLYRAVDAVTSYAYREGKRAGHEEHQDEHVHAGAWGALVEHRGWLANLLTLAASATAASGATLAVGPLVPPLLGWGVAVVAVVVILVRGGMRGNGRC